MADHMRNTVCAVQEEISTLLSSLDAEQMVSFARMVASGGRIFSAGLGRSGLVARAFAMRMMHLGTTSYMVADVATPSIGQGDVLVIVSGSGSVAGMVLVAEKAKIAGARLAVVTGVADSTLARMAEAVVVIPPPAGNKQVQPMGSRFEQGALLTLDCIVMELMDMLDQDETAMYQRHANLE